MDDHLLELFLLAVPFLVGIFCLVWGLRRMHHHQMRQARAVRARVVRNKRSVFFMWVAMWAGILLTSIFFPVLLLVMGTPMALEIPIVLVSGFLLIGIGEYSIRAALLTASRVPNGAAWLVLVGLIMMFFYIPLRINWNNPYKGPALLMVIAVLALPGLLVSLIWGQSRLMKRWRRIGENWRRWSLHVRAIDDGEEG